MTHRLQASALVALFALASCSPVPSTSTEPAAEAAHPMADAGTPDIIGLTAIELRDQLAAGKLSAVNVVSAYLSRIEHIDDSGPTLNAIIQTNPAALDIARELDARFATDGAIGPLHGVPVVLKANINTADAMSTSAGSLALADHVAAADAFHVANLRAAGAVILAKSNLSEWANFRDEKSSSGWSSAGGQTRNPHVLDRNPCGSSSGSAVAVAASLTPLAIGTETNGSIVCPAGINGVVGIKPTLGTVSRGGIIPIAHSQDTAGPMARTVTGAALLLETMIDFDEADPQGRGYPGTAPSLLPDPQQTRLDGLRIGVYRSHFGAGEYPRVEKIYTDSVATLAALGATLIDPVEYAINPATSSARYEVLLFEFKAGLNAYLSGQGLPGDINSLADLIEWNAAHRETAMPIFGQSIFLEAAEQNGLDSPQYKAAWAASVEQMRTDLGALLDEQQLDALFIPVNGPAWKTDWINADRYMFGGTASLSAISGFPSIVVPAGQISGLPIAVGFVGRPLSEPEIIQMAYAFEQATQARIEPAYLPSLESD